MENNASKAQERNSMFSLEAYIQLNKVVWELRSVTSL